MCFRPAGVEIDIHCPHCGFKVPVMGSTILKKCPKCKTTFSDEDIEAMKFNTAIAALMSLVNDFSAGGCTYIQHTFSR